MPTTYTSLLGLALPATGELSGTWGNEVNNFITQYLDASVAGTQTISGSQTAVTLSVTNGGTLTQVGTGATGSAQYAVILCSGNPASTLTITAPSSSRDYLVINATSTNQSVVIRGAATSGVTIAAGGRAVVAWNGSDFVQITPELINGAVPVAEGGTGATTAPNARTNLGATTVGSNLFTLTNPSAITFPRFNADNTVSALNAADFRTAIGAGTGGGDVTLTGTQTLTNKTIAFGSNTLTDVASLNTTQTFTATKTFAGSSSALAMVLHDAVEVATLSATAATGTINYDITTQSVLYYTSNASANWTVNFRASSGTSLNTALATGQSVTVAFLVTQGATAFFNNTIQVDGTSSGVTVRWLGGAPTAGNASGIDSYRYLIIKTGSATFTVLASVTQFRA